MLSPEGQVLGDDCVSAAAGLAAGLAQAGRGLSLGRHPAFSPGPRRPLEEGGRAGPQAQEGGQRMGRGREEDYMAGQGGSVSEGLACSVRQDSGLGVRHAHTGGHLDLDVA